MSEHAGETKAIWLATGCLVAVLLVATMALSMANIPGTDRPPEADRAAASGSLKLAYEVIRWGLLASVLVVLFGVRRPFAAARRPSFDLNVLCALCLAMFATTSLLVGTLKTKALLPVCVAYLVLSAGAMATWVRARRTRVLRHRRLTAVDVFVALVFGIYAADTIFGLVDSLSPKYAAAQFGTAGMGIVLYLYMAGYALGLVTLGAAELEARELGGVKDSMASGGEDGGAARCLFMALGVLTLLALVVMRLLPHRQRL